MTKEELEKEAEEYFKSICGDYNEEYERTGKRHYWVGFDIKNAYLAGAEPRDKQIQIDAEQIRALQKQNGELTDKAKELEAQIEKMKEVILELLNFEDNLDPYMYECDSAQNGELLKPFTNAREFLKDCICKKCKGEGIVRVGYNGWDKNPCPICKGRGYVIRSN